MFQATFNNLRRSWVAFGVIAFGLLLLGGLILMMTWELRSASRWFVQSSLVVVYILFVLGRHLHLNRTDATRPLLPDLGWGNRVTLIRGVLIASVAGFLFLPRPPGWLSWVPGVIYCMVAITDALDGYLARRTNHTTLLGVILDMSLDGLGVLFATLLLVQYGQVPPIYILVGLARYLFLFGSWAAKNLGQSPHELQPSRERRILASLQFVFIGIVLFPVFYPPLTWWAAICFGFPFLLGFTRDFLYVLGVIRPRAANKRLAQLRSLSQLTLRLVLPIIAFTALWQINSNAYQEPQIVTTLILGQIVMSGLILVGIAGRISAGIALILIGINQQFIEPTFLQTLQIAGYTAIVFMGSGPFSVWTPEETWYGPQANPNRNLQVISSKYEAHSEAS